MRMAMLLSSLSALLAPLPLATALAFCPTPRQHQRQKQQSHHEHPRVTFLARSIAGCTSIAKPAFALDSDNNGVLTSASRSADSGGNRSIAPSTKTIIHQPLTINVEGVSVPVAVWHPPSSSCMDELQQQQLNSNVSYEHRIAVSKIGKLLAGWNLPSFVDRNFSLRPSSSSSMPGTTQVRVLSPSPANTNRPQLPPSAPVVLLAHGYLGSRYDLSHLAEALASVGFLVLAPEYPESLAASYDASTRGVNGANTAGSAIDRTMITNRLLSALTKEWNVRPTSYGIVGHSLGCGTVDRTGDASWTRVQLAGGSPSLRGSNCLFVGSVNDGAVGISRALEGLRANDFAALDEEAVRRRGPRDDATLPPRAYLIFGDPANAPNHISFLSEGTNDAMVEFLSPLLPVARALSIPVLDFDKYQVSRDSVGTAEVVIPLVVDYLRQWMT